MTTRSLFKVTCIILLGLSCRQAYGQARPTLETVTGLIKQISDDHDVEIVLDPPDVQGKAGRKLQNADGPLLVDFLQGLSREFGKCNPNLLRNAGSIRLCVLSSMWDAKDGTHSYAFYSPAQDAIYCEVGVGKSPDETANVLHHEFFHLLQHRLYGDYRFIDPKWAALQPEGFTYGRGGAYVIKHNPNLDMGVLTHPYPGFINLYSTSAVWEDQAEIYSALFQQKNERVLRKWAETDPHLAVKIAYIERFVNYYCEDRTSPRDRNYLELLKVMGTNRADIVSGLLNLPDSENPRDVIGPHGMSLAHLICSRNKSTLFPADVKMDLHALDNDGWSPLHYAAIRGNRDQFFYKLLQAGADPQWKDWAGRSAKEWSIQTGSIEKRRWTEAEAATTEALRDPRLRAAYDKGVEQRRRNESAWREAIKAGRVKPLPGSAVSEKSKEKKGSH